MNGSSAETKLNGITVEKGDMIDFVVDARSILKMTTSAGRPSSSPATRRGTQRMTSPDRRRNRWTVWARYAQVLLETNEFAFVD